MACFGRIRFRGVSSRGNMNWDLKMMSAIEKCQLPVFGVERCLLQRMSTL